MDFGATACNLLQIETLLLSPKDLQQATAADPVLSVVLQYSRDGWPADVGTALKLYFNRRAEMSIDRGCLFLGSRVVVPAKFQEQVLGELHAGHQGMVKMKGLARLHAWWPGIDKEIEHCQATRSLPLAMPLHPWRPSTPWERIHVDFAEVCVFSSSRQPLQVVAYGEHHDREDPGSSASSFCKVRATKGSAIRQWSTVHFQRIRRFYGHQWNQAPTECAAPSSHQRRCREVCPDLQTGIESREGR